MSSKFPTLHHMIRLCSFLRLNSIPLVVLVVKTPPANAGDGRDTDSIPGLGRSPGGEHGNPLQYSCLENPMDREAWQSTVHRVTKSWTQLKQLNTQYSTVHFYHIFIIHFGLPRWHSGKKILLPSWRCRFNPWVGMIPWWRKCNPLQYSCLGNHMNRGA